MAAGEGHAEEAAALRRDVAADVAESSKFLYFRRLLFDVTFRNKEAFPKRRKLDSAKYELANIISRFYMCARNEMLDFQAVVQKMLDELREKGMDVPSELVGLRFRNIDDVVLALLRSGGDGGGEAPHDDADQRMAAAEASMSRIFCDEIAQTTHGAAVSFDLPGHRCSMAPNLSLSIDAEKYSDLLERAKAYLQKVEVDETQGAPDACGVRFAVRLERGRAAGAASRSRSRSPRREAPAGPRRPQGGRDEAAPAASPAASIPLSAALLLKVTAANYLVASGSLYWGFGPRAYEAARTSLNARLEAYASPFNHSLARYCSPFALDRVFGSLGSFYRVRNWGEMLPELRAGADAELRDRNERTAGPPSLLTIVANPPYIESEIELCAQQVAGIMAAAEHLRSSGASALPPDFDVCVVSICPAWFGARGILEMQCDPEGFAPEADGGVDCPRAAALLAGGARGDRHIPARHKVYEKELGKCQHSYFNYQTSKYIPAMFVSLGFAYCSQAGCENGSIVARVDKLFGELVGAAAAGGGSRRKKWGGKPGRADACSSAAA